MDFTTYFAWLALALSFVVYCFAMYGVIRLAIAHERAAAGRTAPRKPGF